MIDHILGRLELADRFEENAKRHQSSRKKAPNWQRTAAMCMREARRQRAKARKLAREHGLSFNRLMEANDAERQVQGLWSGDIEDVTVGEILRCAAIARSSSIGTRRFARAAERVIRVAEVLDSAGAFRQFVRGAGEVPATSPIRPAEVVSGSEAGSWLETKMRSWAS